MCGRFDVPTRDNFGATIDHFGQWPPWYERIGQFTIQLLGNSSQLHKRDLSRSLPAFGVVQRLPSHAQALRQLRRRSTECLAYCPYPACWRDARAVNIAQWFDGPIEFG